MLTYTPQPKQLMSPLPCPFRAQSSIMEQLDVPGTPWMQTVPLPSSTIASPSQDGRLFPFEFLHDLSHTQQRTLRSITLTTPVHVHVPFAHIGMVHGYVPGQRINALELIRCLRAAYDQLSQRVDTQFGMNFMRWPVHPPSATGYQSNFTSVRRSGNGLVGYDPLLENDEIWGLEPISFEGYSVVHLAGRWKPF